MNQFKRLIIFFNYLYLFYRLYDLQIVDYLKYTPKKRLTNI